MDSENDKKLRNQHNSFNILYFWKIRVNNKILRVKYYNEKYIKFQKYIFSCFISRPTCHTIYYVENIGKFKNNIYLLNYSFYVINHHINANIQKNLKKS